jgi:hypothetical protein
VTFALPDEPRRREPADPRADDDEVDLVGDRRIAIVEPFAVPDGVCRVVGPPVAATVTGPCRRIDRGRVRGVVDRDGPLAASVPAGRYGAASSENRSASASVARSRSARSTLSSIEWYWLFSSDAP